MLRNRVFMVRNAEIWAVLSTMRRFADAQESRIHSATYLQMGSAFLAGFDLLMLRNILFSFRNVQMWAAPP